MKKILLVMVSIFILSASALNAGQISTSDSTMLFGQSHVHNVALLDKSEMMATQGEGLFGGIFGGVIAVAVDSYTKYWKHGELGVYVTSNIVTGIVAGAAIVPF
jgi:hypothetical protein